MKDSLAIICDFNSVPVLRVNNGHKPISSVDYGNARAEMNKNYRQTISNYCQRLRFSIVTEFCRVTLLEVVELLKVICRFFIQRFSCLLSHVQMTADTNLPRCTSDIL